MAGKSGHRRGDKRKRREKAERARSDKVVTAGRDSEKGANDGVTVRWVSDHRIEPATVAVFRGERFRPRFRISHR